MEIGHTLLYEAYLLKSDCNLPLLSLFLSANRRYEKAVGVYHFLECIWISLNNGYVRETEVH